MISVLSHIFLDQSINKLRKLAFQLKCIIQHRKINIPCLFLCMVEASNDQSSKKVQIVKFSSYSRIQVANRLILSTVAFLLKMNPSCQFRFGTSVLEQEKYVLAILISLIRNRIRYHMGISCFFHLSAREKYGCCLTVMY